MYVLQEKLYWFIHLIYNVSQTKDKDFLLVLVVGMGLDVLVVACSVVVVIVVGAGTAWTQHDPVYLKSTIYSNVN
jgi:hypothetical protein